MKDGGILVEKDESKEDRGDSGRSEEKGREHWRV